MEKSIINSPTWVVAIHALIEMDTLERMTILGQDALELELNKLHEAMDKDYKTFTYEGEEGYYLAHINDEYIEVAETLPCLYWYSQFLMAYSFFERALDALCMSMQRECKISISLKDISGQGISRAKTYMQKLCNIKNVFESSEWHQAGLFSEIRNTVAHKNGFIDNLPSDKRSLYHRLSTKGIELKSDLLDQEDARVILKRDIIIEAVNVYRIIIKEIAGLDRGFITPKHGLPSSP